MPKYDLRCSDCGGEFNARASISEKTKKQIQCPKCGSVELLTMFKSPPAFNKGAGKCPDRAGCGSTGCRYA